MSASVLIERASGGDDDLRTTSISDVPFELPTDDDIPPVGTVLDDRYEITGILGHGGMGHVLSARHVVLRHKLAIKVLRREMTRDTEIVERFRREAKAASAIGHSGIVAVKDFGALPSGASYYVMEHVDGMSLSEAIEKGGTFSVERAIDVIRQAADALGAAHAAGIVHRDVKAENILLTSFAGHPDHVKVLDFGICKLDFASRLSGAHRVLGTPAYMSPEQARGQKLDQRADIYALGILFFELLVGDVPFDDRSPLEVLRHQISTTPPRVDLLRSDVPVGIADIIARCLEKDPDARPSTMQVLSELLGPGPHPFVPSIHESTLSAPTPVPVVSRPIATYENSSVAITPRPTPTLMVPAPTRSRWMILAAGLVLTVIGVAALAAAGGVVARERSDQGVVAEAPITPVVVPVVAAPVVPALASETPIASVSVTPPPASASPVVIAHPPHSARHVAQHAEAAASARASEPASDEPPPPAHSAIRVLDPWGDSQ